MSVNLNRFEKYKESEHYTVYLEKEVKDTNKPREMLVYYKTKDKWSQCVLNQALSDLLFNPAKFKMEHMTKQR